MNDLEQSGINGATRLENSENSENPVPLDYDGMRVDVYDDESRLLFDANLKVIAPNLVALERLSDISSEITDNIAIYIRGFQSAQNIGVRMRGFLKRLAPTQDRDWIIRDFQIIGEDRGRVFSRTPLRADAWISPDLDLELKSWRECIVINASAGGARVQINQPLEYGSRVYIKFRLRRGKEQPPLACFVHQGSERDKIYEYGCEFIDITPEVESVIAKTLIELQLMD